MNEWMNEWLIVYNCDDQSRFDIFLRKSNIHV